MASTTTDFAEMVDSGARQEKLENGIEQLRQGTAVFLPDLVSRDRPLGRLLAYDEYRSSVPLEARAFVDSLRQEYERKQRCLAEAAFLRRCEKEQAVPEGFRVKIWPGLSRHSASFDDEWEKKVHGISLRLMAVAATAHVECSKNSDARIASVRDQLMGTRRVTEGEVSALQSLFTEWMRKAMADPWHTHRYAQVVASYGTTPKQHKKARGKQPAANQSGRSRAEQAAAAMQRQREAAARGGGGGQRAVPTCLQQAVDIDKLKATFEQAARMGQ